MQNKKKKTKGSQSLFFNLTTLNDTYITNCVGRYKLIKRRSLRMQTQHSTSNNSEQQKKKTRKQKHRNNAKIILKYVFVIFSFAKGKEQREEK